VESRVEKGLKVVVSQYPRDPSLRSGGQQGHGNGKKGKGSGKIGQRQRPGCGWEKMWVEKRISPLRCSQKREQPRSK
jgi:hypothetical protein